MTEKIAENLSYEEALNELEKIVTALESGKAPLEDSIDSYERGMALKAYCEQKLNAAQEKIEKITLKNDGSTITEPLDKAE